MAFCELINVHFPGSQNFSEPIKTLLTTISNYARGPQCTNRYRVGGLLGAVREERPPTRRQREWLPPSEDKHKNETFEHNSSPAGASPEKPGWALGTGTGQDTSTGDSETVTDGGMGVWADPPDLNHSHTSQWGILRTESQVYLSTGSLQNRWKRLWKPGYFTLPLPSPTCPQAHLVWSYFPAGLQCVPPSPFANLTTGSLIILTKA